MASKVSYYCNGFTAEGWVCDKAPECARFNLSATVSRLCYSGYSFFVPKVTDKDHSEQVANNGS